MNNVCKISLIFGFVCSLYCTLTCLMAFYAFWQTANELFIRYALWGFFLLFLSGLSFAIYYCEKDA